jgi:hypothetical protein
LAPAVGEVAKDIFLEIFRDNNPCAMITPTEINQATNFIWYASVPVLIATYLLAVPAALLVFYKLLETFGMETGAFWLKGRKGILVCILIFSVGLVVCVRIDGSRQAEKAGKEFKKLAITNGWNAIGISDIKANINPEYDASFMLNIIKEDPGSFQSKRVGNEIGIAVVPGSELDKELQTCRQSAITKIQAGAIQRREKDPAIYKNGGVYLPFETVNRFVENGDYINRVVYVVSNNPDIFRPECQGGIVSNVTVLLPE